jgi:processive 1,2-diacylglycerol beta-glucosyltransferase
MPARPVLILSADVGEGHLAAARALEEDLQARGVPAIHRDGLSALGRVARAVIRDGYRLQLRVAPWSYSFMYTIFNHVPPLRHAGEAALCRLGRRRLLRIIAGHDPAVVVSTHPAITAVLGRLRRGRRLGIPVVAPITDLADYAIWSHPGADVHLVMHPAAVEPVERVAGPGSAVLTGPLVAPRFRVARDSPRARAELGLPDRGTLVAVSGGGWGVGDLAGATTAALAADADHVVVVAGRNAAAESMLRERFTAEPRVSVWGFTTQMDVLLRAANALVHSTGGVTSLEALSCGCPMIAYGASAGHIKVHNTTMAHLGLIDLAPDRPTLATKLEALLAAPSPAASPPAVARAAPGRGVDVAAPPCATARGVQDGTVVLDAATVVATALPRITPLPVWRTALGAAALPVTLTATLLYGALGTNDAYTLAARPLELKPVTQLTDAGDRVAVVVRSDGTADAQAVRQALGPHVHVTFAVPAGALATTGAGAIPALPRSGPVRWLDTRRALDGRRYVLAPEGGGASVGQALLARSAHATALAGQEPGRAAGGSIVVVDDDGSPAATAATVRSLSRALAARGLRAGSLSSLLAARTAGAASSSSAQPTTSTTPNPINNG